MNKEYDNVAVELKKLREKNDEKELNHRRFTETFEQIEYLYNLKKAKINEIIESDNSVRCEKNGIINIAEEIEDEQKSMYQIYDEEIYNYQKQKNQFLDKEYEMEQSKRK